MVNTKPNTSLIYMLSFLPVSPSARILANGFAAAALLIFPLSGSASCGRVLPIF